MFCRATELGFHEDFGAVEVYVLYCIVLYCIVYCVAAGVCREPKRSTTVREHVRGRRGRTETRKDARRIGDARYISLSLENIDRRFILCMSPQFIICYA